VDKSILEVIQRRNYMVSLACQQENYCPTLCVSVQTTPGSFQTKQEMILMTSSCHTSRNPKVLCRYLAILQEMTGLPSTI
jgi:hypothetical protein